MLIDFHTHVFPDALAEKTVPYLAAKGNVTPYGAATLADTRAKMKQWGVDKAVMLSIATNERQMRKVNDFAAMANSEDVIAFGSVYPKCEEAFDELDRIKALGLPGVKFHPEYQEYRAGDEKYFKLYEKCARLGLIMTFHAGKDVGYPDTLMAPPKELAEIAKAFPGSKLVFAHMGGFAVFEDVLKYLAGTDCYLDTAVVDEILPVELAREIIAAHTARRILFGTDCPWGRVPQAKAYIEALGLPQEDLDAIYSGNAMRLLGIK